MSYILDALRRAEADRERDRGRLPGLHTQAGTPDESTPRGGRGRLWPWMTGVLLLLIGLGVGSWWAGSRPDSQSEPPAPQPVGLARAPVPAPAPTLAPSPAPAASASPYLPPAPPPVLNQPQRPAPATPAAASAGAATPLLRLAELPESLRRELPKLAISGTVYADEPSARFVVINGEIQREGARLAPELVLEQIGPRELVLRFKGQRFRQPV